MTHLDLKILLLKMGMTKSALSRELHCSRYSITAAFRLGNRPGVMRKIVDFYERNKRRVA